MSAEWGRLQYLHLGSSKDEVDRRMAARWTEKIIQRLWSEWFLLWETRNLQVHGHDQITREASKRAQVIREVRTIYALKGKVMPVDEHAFYDTVEAHTDAQNANQMRNWVTLWKDVMVTSVQTALHRGIRGMQTIASLFARQNTLYGGNNDAASSAETETEPEHEAAAETATEPNASPIFPQGL